MKSFILTALLTTVGIQANASVIDFNGNNPLNYPANSVISNNFIATPKYADDNQLSTTINFDWQNVSIGDGVYLANWSNAESTTSFSLRNLNDTLFSLHSFDFDNAYDSGMFPLSASRTSTITVTGNYADNTTVTQTFDNLFDNMHWLTLSLNSTFTNMQSVTFTASGQPYVRALYDNIVVDEIANSVPEPTSLALLGFGLAGLAAARRKKP